MLRTISVFIIISLFSFQINGQGITIDEEIGKSSNQQIIASMGIAKAPVTCEFVNQVGERLIARVEQPFTFRFQVVDSPIPNAFALPGGYIYVTRGILAIMNSEDELAGVIGHEIMHVLERHSINQLKRNILPAILQIPGNVIGIVNEDYGNLINAPLKSSSQVFLASYSRGHETEADLNGIEIMSRAGYDPMALATALENLSKTVELVMGEGEKRSYLNDHPYTPKRVTRIHKKVERLNWKPKPGITGNKYEFYKKLDGLYYGQDPAGGVFRDQQFIHYDLDFTITFPEGWKTENTPQAVGAIEPDEHALVYLGVKEDTLSPKDRAEMVIDIVKRKRQTSPDRAEEINVNGFDGYLITYSDESGSVPTYFSCLWLGVNGLTFQIIGFGYQEHMEILDKSVLSIRKPTEEEKASVYGSVIKAVLSKSGETIESLSARTRNTWDKTTTALANDIPEDKVFEEGEPVKIIIKEQYIGKK